ncbi:hypothetical protein HUJ05_009741, partial [Dendroctonus ponderosae]
ENEAGTSSSSSNANIATEGGPVKQIDWGNHSAADLRIQLPKVLRSDKLSEENGSWCKRRRPGA